MFKSTEMLFNCVCFLELNNDWKKAESVWTKMQEENVVPRERTLRLLADILRTNGQEVPFEVPKVKEQTNEALTGLK